MASVCRLYVLIALIALCQTLRAEEGFWMPEQVGQLSDELKAVGIKLPAARLSDLNQAPLSAIVQMSGCTGSFVSTDGLILTNYHCAFPSIQYNSTPQRDLTGAGFLALNRSDELWSGPLSRVFVTSSVREVTEELVANIPAGISNRQRYAAIDRKERELIRECEKVAGVRCRVVSTFEGLQYHLITQKEIRDVRLVYAPQRAIGEFGGDVDNWTWPRHTADFAFFRAYVGKDGSFDSFSKKNVPFTPPSHLKVSTRGINAGDPLLVLGYPAKSYRYKTSDETREVRDAWYPRSIRYTRQYINILKTVGSRNDDVRLRNASALLKSENQLKNMEGTLAGVRAGKLVERKEDEERRLRARMTQAPEQEVDVLLAMREMEMRSRLTQQRDDAFYWMMRVSPLFWQALTLHRVSLERPKADADRQWGYQERDLPRIQEAIERSQRSLDVETERAALRFILLEIARLPGDQRIVAIDALLAQYSQDVRCSGAERASALRCEEQIDQFLNDLYARTRMTDVLERLKMLKQDTPSLRRRKDTFLELASSLTPLIMEIEAREEEDWAAMTAVRPRYMEKLKELRGGKLYPDGNGTLRVSYGRVEGYSPGDAVQYSPQTTLSGLLGKERDDPPFALPPRFQRAARDAKSSPYLDEQLGAIPVNFLSTADTTGGSSGSPTLNAEGELVGIVFDGNYEAISSDFLFNRDLTRSIHVDSIYMLWLMDAVDRAHNVMRELAIEPRFD